MEWDAIYYQLGHAEDYYCALALNVQNKVVEVKNLYYCKYFIIDWCE